MTKLLYLLALLVILGGSEPAAANHEAYGVRAPDLGQHEGRAAWGQSSLAGQRDPAIRTIQYDANTSQGRDRDVIAPSVALRVALSYSPGSQGLGVNLLRGRRLVYAVKLKTGNRVHRVLVDARTGQVVGN